MFTGIVRERGAVTSFERGRLVVESSLEPDVGDSVSVDGVCLTVTGRENGRLSFDVMEEDTCAVEAVPRRGTNLEPALRAGDPLGGHYVQGHVDGVGRVRDRDGERMTIEAPPEILRYCVEKGSITVEGVSLTVAALEEEAFAVALVAHTLEVTTARRAPVLGTRSIWKWTCSPSTSRARLTSQYD